MPFLITCSGTPSASFELDVPSAVAKSAAWYEIGVVAARCPSTATLLGGIPAEGTVGRIAFAASATTPPGLGILPKGSYGVAAVARATDCSVIATGCSPVDISSGGTIAVSLTAVADAAAGACAAGAACDEATCVPSADAGSVSGGPGCSLALLGAGPLADPLTDDTTLLSAPAIAATSTGFLIAYREFDPTGGAARLTTLAIDPSGGAAAPVQTTLPGACVGSPETDATALAFSGAAGTVVVSRPACSTDAGATSGGVDIFAVNATGAVSTSSFSGGPGIDITLAQAHALAYTPLGLLLAYTNPTMRTSYAATIANATLAKSPPQVAFSGFDQLASETDAFVIAAALGTGFLALGPASHDGGASTGVAASFGSEPGDAGDAGPGAASTYPAKWVSAGGVGSRIIVASNGPSSSNPILWSAFDVGTSAAASTGTFSPENGGTVSFVDVALHQDHAFFAAEVDQSLSLFAFEKASTFPLQLVEVPFSTQTTIPVGALRDGLVAVAASDTRVAVVWGTGRTLGNDDAVGGYAVFACTP